MGDIVEFTTHHLQKHVYHKLNSSSLSVDIKGAGSACIGFSRTLSARCDFYIIIGNGRRHDTSFIYANGKISNSIIVQNTINSAAYQTFLITWSYGRVKLQLQNVEPQAYTCLQTDTKGIQYVSFNQNRHQQQPLSWRVELPPQLPTRPLKAIQSGASQWVACADQLPDGVTIGGYEREVLYIIRAKHRGSLTPGPFVPSQGLGFVPWGGLANEKNEFEALCGYDVSWVLMADGDVPVGAVVAGHSEQREPLFVGRAVHGAHLIPGKVQPSHKCCYIPSDGREVAKKSYEVLVRTKPSNAAHEVMLTSSNPDFDAELRAHRADHELHQLHVLN